MKHRESGNILLYILIAVMLFAALSFAFTRGGRDSGQSLSLERQRLLATEIVDYGDTISKAVTMIRLRGVPLTSLSFAAAGLNPAYGVPGAAPPNEIFNTAGGGIVYKDVTADAIDQTVAASQSYIFTAGNEITGIGTTCAASACADLLIMLPALNKDVCIAINSAVGVGNPGDDPPVASQADTTPFAGTVTYAKTIGGDAGSAALAGKTAGCFLDNTAHLYTYYQVLQPR